jgi:ribosomal protein S13
MAMKGRGKKKRGKRPICGGLKEVRNMKSERGHRAQLQSKVRARRTKTRTRTNEESSGVQD